MPRRAVDRAFRAAVTKREFTAVSEQKCQVEIGVFHLTEPFPAAAFSSPFQARKQLGEFDNTSFVAKARNILKYFKISLAPLAGFNFAGTRAPRTAAGDCGTNQSALAGRRRR